MPEDCEKKAADLSFDLTKQFLTLAFGGIAFVVGLSFSTPGAISALMLWLVVGTFGVSAALGILFLMNGVNRLGIQKSFDVYASSLRFLAILQIVTMLLGTVFLGLILKNHGIKPTDHSRTVEVKTDAAHSVTYPLDPDKDITIEIDGSRLKVTTSK
jgi:hypothetical protein